MANLPITISPTLTKILRAGRPQFNAQVAEAKHRYPAFKTEDFSNFLIESVDPLVQAVQKAMPDYCSSVLVVAYDIALNLIGRDLAGPHVHNQRMNRLWQTIFPVLAVRVAESPQLVLGALSNALINIETLSGGRPDQWLDMMQKLAPQTSSCQQLLNIGVLVAWCCGAAHFRQAALRISSELPDALVLNALGVDKKISTSVLLQNLENNPWWLLQLQTTSKQGIQKEVGAFSGFGGSFSTPPLVRVNDDGFVVKSGDRYNILIADSYGAVFLPATEEEFNTASKFLSDNKKNASPPVLQGSCVNSGSKWTVLNLPQHGLELVYNEHTIALTSPYSFAITLVPR
jgi:hypothetical protein